MFELDVKGLQEQLKAKAQKVEESARAIAFEGSDVLYKQVLQNVPVGTKGHWFHGTSFKKSGQKYWFNAGSLRKSIYQVYSKTNSADGKATYHISWNKTEAPYGFMVENGTSKSAAHPFLRPAQGQAGGRALDAMKKKLAEVVNA
ncbi:HK97-gp10 family putative phage morphogenesis protein [Diaphorobacter caeni]|uniref:HK97-gp10 family putative phage morphogenesis protein n=1 Tax=Diaphorobacter caeni TaxID=2784387 RepID=UPI00188ED503|nr:HK97-gp10 family putative phage morphogenesis protein [Diaphorobacter caeni]MBF5006005.1 hypothetical protein [Diaphorobacter caeni]